MPDIPMLWPQLFETVMLFCFGASWPFSILKTWRTRKTTGKSAVFLTLVFIGYTAGVIAKLWRAHLLGTPPEWVTALYAFNGTLVFIDLMLYHKFSRCAAEK